MKKYGVRFPAGGRKKVYLLPGIFLCAYIHGLENVNIVNNPMSIRFSQMKRAIPASVILICFSAVLMGQPFRSVDGSGNNPQNPEWGAADVRLVIKTPLDYGDGIASPNGANRPNPRTVSNAIAVQNDDIFDQDLRSDYVWVFGQFVSHEIIYNPNNNSEPIGIPVPAFDPVFDPDGSGDAQISMFRSAFDPSTGTTLANPRIHINAVSSFLDGSAVYGSDDHRANWLRTFLGGKLKVSAGNLLPFNTVTGEFNDPTDPSAPFMKDESGVDQKLFVAGDARANENPLLLTLHTLFVREHNRQCDLLQVTHPEYSEEELYQQAKRIVTAHIQSIFFDEWLNEVGITLPQYSGYNSDVQPGVSNIFSAAAFKLKHTLANSLIKRMNVNGETIALGNLSLGEGFYDPREILIAGGIEPYIKGMGVQVQQTLDCRIIDQLRNFIPESQQDGGIDVASINIMRGRERGLSDFNTIRQAFDLEPYENFSEVCTDEQVAVDLNTLYGSVDNLDAWVGLMAEDHESGSILGPTLKAILVDQFTALRDGDRYYYENDPLFSSAEISEIKNTLFSDIITRNSGIGLMQKNVFKAMKHEDIPFDNVVVVKRKLDIALFPNPVYDLANFKVYSFQSGAGSFQIFDLNGKLISNEDIQLVDGENTMSFAIGNVLLPGMYFARFAIGEDENFVKLIVH